MAAILSIVRLEQGRSVMVGRSSKDTPPQEASFSSPMLSQTLLRIQEGRKTLPMTYAQERVWFLQQIIPENIFSKFMSFQLVGALDITALESAFRSLQARHDVLRTQLNRNEGSVHQIVVAPHRAHFSMLVEDVRFLDHDSLSEYCLLEQNKPFDLYFSFLWRVKLLKLSDHYRLMISMHHLIADEDSWELFLRELSFLYKANVSHSAYSLTPIQVQYGDFANQQRCFEKTEYLEANLSYWKKYLHQFPELQFTTDYPRPATQSFQGESLDFDIEEDIVEKLKKIANQAKTSLHVAFLSAFTVLLARYTGQEDIVTGTLISERNEHFSHKTMGNFTNSLVLRSNLSEAPSFFTVLARNDLMLKETAKHSSIPFQLLVKGLEIKTDWSRNPLFQVALLWGRKRYEKLALEGLASISLPIETRLSWFDLTLILDEAQGKVVTAIEYNTNLFDAITIERLRKNFKVLLKNIVENPEQSITTLPLLSEEEVYSLLVETNDTYKPYSHEKTLQAAFYEQVLRTPDALCVVYEERSLTYREVDIRANHLAKLLISQGVEANSIVGLCTGQDIDMIIGMLGILKSGAAYAPIDPSYPTDRIEYILSDIDAKMLITQKQFKEKLCHHGLFVIVIDSSDESPIEVCDPPCNKTTSRDLAYLIYTSGSTGKPKGVCCSHQGVINLIEDLQDKSPLVAGDNATLLANMNFDGSIDEIWAAFLSGCCLHILTYDVRRNHEKIFNYLKDKKIHHAYLHPFMIKNLADWVRKHPDTIVLKRLKTAVEPVNEKLLIFIKKNIPRLQIINGYGPTETSICCLYYLLKEQNKSEKLRKNTPIGKPVKNMQAYILDESFQLLPSGAIGELYVGGVGLAKGYQKLADMTAEKFIKNPFSDGVLYRTGDFVRRRNDGNFEYFNRADEQVKINSIRIELGEIQNCLSELKIIKECCVLIRRDLSGKRRLTAYLVKNTDYQSPLMSQMWSTTLGDRQLISMLKNYLQGRLPKFMIPSRFFIMTSIPATENGKLDYSKLPAIDIEQQKSEFIFAKTETEVLVSDIFMLAFGVSEIDLNRSIFDLGACSLKMVEIVNKINQFFNIELPLILLFDAHLICELVSEVERKLAQKALLLDSIHRQLIVLTLQGKGKKPPLFIIKASVDGKLCYYDLAKHIGNERPVYCIEEREGQQGTEDDIHKIATSYLNFILEVQPQGYYLLCGFAQSGTIAVEIARKLRKRGKCVGFVGVFDFHPGLLISPGDKLTFFKPLEAEAKKDCFENVSRYFGQNNTDCIDVYLVPGNVRNFLAEPHVKVFAKSLKACLDKTDVKEFQKISLSELCVS